MRWPAVTCAAARLAFAPELRLSRSSCQADPPAPVRRPVTTWPAIPVSRVARPKSKPTNALICHMRQITIPTIHAATIQVIFGSLLTGSSWRKASTTLVVISANMATAVAPDTGLSSFGNLVNLLGVDAESGSLLLVREGGDGDRDARHGTRRVNLADVNEAERWVQFGQYLVERRRGLGLTRREAAKRSKLARGVLARPREWSQVLRRRSGPSAPECGGVARGG